MGDNATDAMDAISNLLTDEHYNRIAESIKYVARDIHAGGRIMPELLAQSARSSLKLVLHPVAYLGPEVSEIIDGDLSFLADGLEERGLLSNENLKIFKEGVALDTQRSEVHFAQQGIEGDKPEPF